MNRKAFWALAITGLFLVQSCRIGESPDVADENADETENRPQDTRPLDEGEGVFVEWDTDEDDYISRREFGERTDHPEIIPEDWETEDDAEIDEDDWGTAVYTTGDRDDDDQWDENEYNQFTARWDDQDWGTWEEWDANEDDMIDREEWQQGAADRELFQTWDEDRNQRLSQQEMDNFTYSFYDADRDGRLNELEFDDFVRDHGLPRPPSMQRTEDNEQ